MKTGSSILKKIYAFCLLILFIVGGIFFAKQYMNGTFSDLDTFQDYVNSYGLLGPVILGLFQCFKVIYAVIPGTIGYIVGPTLFGSVLGIIANYIGICTGSIIAFCLSKRYGETIMRLIFPKRYYERSMNWIKRKTDNFSIALWFLLLIPFSPDDFLCYFAGLTEMKFKRFLLIILTVKPWLIIIYGLIFGKLFN